MSMLGTDTYNELTQTLQALQSPDNAIRSQAEDYLQNTWVNSRPEYLLLGLVEHIGNSNDVPVRVYGILSFPSYSPTSY